MCRYDMVYGDRYTSHRLLERLVFAAAIQPNTNYCLQGARATERGGGGGLRGGGEGEAGGEIGGEGRRGVGEGGGESEGSRDRILA
jgi:hypothetical protein